jgi:cell division protease FtsH
MPPAVEPEEEAKQQPESSPHDTTTSSSNGATSSSSNGGGSALGPWQAVVQRLPPFLRGGSNGTSSTSSGSITSPDTAAKPRSGRDKQRKSSKDNDASDDDEASDDESDEEEDNTAGRAAAADREASHRQRRGGAAGDADGDQRRQALRRALAVLRALALGAIAGLVFGAVRLALAARQRSAPREVLYSDLLALVDAGKVRAARLEAGTSRVYFDVVVDEAEKKAAVAAGKEQQQKKGAAAKPAEAKATASAGAVAAASAAATKKQQKGAATAATAASPNPNSLPLIASRKPPLARRYYVKVADKHDPLLTSRLLAAGVEFGVVRASATAALGNVFVAALALWLPLLPLFFMLRRAMDARSGGGAAGTGTFGRRAARGKRGARGEPAAPRVTFADVAGCEAAKAELLECVACLRDAERYARVRARMPGGVVLYGPPGTGKTLLAKAVAGEAGVPFIATSASEFVELFVGRGAQRVRELFAEARKLSPCVIFIDELDALGAKRGGNGGGNDERDQTLNQLLTELDGFVERPGVLVLAATNRIDVLDPALLRPGRISRRVRVPRPDPAGRAAVLKVHLRGVPMDGGSAARADAAERLSLLTEGFSGAELSNVVNEAALLAARGGRDSVGLADLLEGVRRTRFGVEGGGTGGGGGVAGGGGPLRALSAWLLQVATAGALREPPLAGSSDALRLAAAGGGGGNSGGGDSGKGRAAPAAR